MLSKYVSIFIIVGSFASALSLKCREGVNVTFGTIPFYQWTERECNDKSECFSQEISVPFVKNLAATVQYGGCISSYYASLITCKNLYGPDSKFNPALLLNMFTELDDMVDDMVEDFRVDTVEKIKILFSNGDGAEGFVDGVFKSFEAMGFNMSKAQPLKPHLAKLVPLAFSDGSTPQRYHNEINETSYALLKDLKTFDTRNPRIARNLFSFIKNFGFVDDDIDLIKEKPESALITNLPGLVKSTLPKSWEVEKWYDVIFDILGDINMMAPRKSTSDVIKTIKSASNIPESYKKYLDPVFDTLPDLVFHLVRGNTTYAQIWSLKLLEAESITNEKTVRLSNSINSFVEKVLRNSGATYIIKFLPGLFYNFFPAEKEEIDRVYDEMATGFESIDLRNPTKTLEETELSRFVSIFTNIYTGPPGPQTDAMKAMINLFTINFSKTFYNLMGPKYTDKLDTFFRTLKKGFVKFPQINVGEIIVNLVTNMGGSVPTEIEPMLNNAHNVVNAMSVQGPDSAKNIIDAFITITNEYEVKYPKSEFPGLAKRYMELMKTRVTGFPHFPCDNSFNYNDPLPGDEPLPDGALSPDDICVAKWNKDLMEFGRNISDTSRDLSIDTYFAVFEYGYANPKVRPYLLMPLEFQEPYMSMIRLLDKQDVKELVKDFQDWMNKMRRMPSLSNFDSFIHAVNASVYKISTKLSSVMKDLREFHRPQSCKHVTCSDDNCNSHKMIDDVIPFTKAMKQKQKAEKTTAKPDVTTSSCGNVVTTILLNVATLWVAYKALSE